MSTPVTPALIKELRDRTGVGMGKCKEALEQTGGDLEKAIDNLRKAGMATAVKKEGRATNEGMIATAQNGSAIAIVEVNAETDFVVKNERFQEFLKNIADEVAKTKPASVEVLVQQPYSKDPNMTVDQYRATIIQTIGENIQIRRLHVIEKNNDRSVGIYSHLGGKIVTMVEITGSGSEEALARDIAMHTAAAAPEYLAAEDVPAAVLANERDIAKTQVKGKPDNVVDKIVEGKVNSFYDSSCLLRQKFIRDDEVTIAQLVGQRAKETGKPLAVARFLRWSVGQ